MVSSLGLVDYTIFARISNRSPDGTIVLTSSADDALRFFILPVELLSSGPKPHTLTPYTLHRPPEPVCATAFHPSFSLQEPSSCMILAALRGLPLRLISPFALGKVASYPLVSPTTEAYITPSSLLFDPADPNKFFAGSDSCLNVFDIKEDGQGPVNRLHTTPSKRGHVADGRAMKGIVSAMAMSSEGVLGAGTYSRWVGLYDRNGFGNAGVFPIASGKDKEDDVGGSGLTQLLWSNCGKYLCTIERKSNGIGVWDIRGTGTRLAWLKGRNADTQQRLGVDVIGSEVWAGGTDGFVRLWEGLGQAEGIIDPNWEFQTHTDAVSSASLHPTGCVLATCSGQRHSLLTRSPDESDTSSDSDGSSTDLLSHRSTSGSVSPSVSSAMDKTSSSAHAFDNSLKVWAL